MRNDILDAEEKLSFFAQLIRNKSFRWVMVIVMLVLLVTVGLWKYEEYQREESAKATKLILELEGVEAKRTEAMELIDEIIKAKEKVDSFKIKNNSQDWK